MDRSAWRAIEARSLSSSPDAARSSLLPRGLMGVLADGFALADTLYEVEVAVTAGDSFDDEHADVVTATPCRVQQKTVIQPKMLLLHIFRVQMSPIIYQ